MTSDHARQLAYLICALAYTHARIRRRNERLDILACIYSHILVCSQSFTSTYPPYLRLAQDPQLTIARSIARHEKSTLRIPCQPRRPEAARTETRPITLAAFNPRIVEDILGCRRAGQWLDRCVLSISTELEAHSDQLETCDRGAVPRTMVRDVHGARVGIELAVDGRRVWEEGELGSNSLLDTGIVVEGVVGCLDEEVTDLESLVGEVGWLPYGEARWIAIPVIIGLGDIAHVVDLLAGVVMVDVLGLTIHSALKVVAAVLDTPEPIETLAMRISIRTNMFQLTCCSCRSTCQPRCAVRSRQCSHQRHSCIHH
jgi:hypothetical protein